MRAFELVTIVVSLVAIGLALTSYFRVSRVLERLGRHGQTWFDHADDLEPPQRPDPDQRDDPIPRRPLRGRPER
jgi:hypothetical protein